jgi:hypothetical protein
VTPFGGLNFVIDKIEDAGIPMLIEESLGKRDGRSKYSYQDAILGMIYGIFCGADRLEDMKKLKGRMHNSSLNIPSPDVIGKIMKDQLSVRDTKIKSSAGNTYKLNINKPMNGLLIDAALKLRLLSRAAKYTLDFDHVPLPSEKYDSTVCFKGFKAYMPGVSWIGHIPVFIEGQEGHNPPAFGQVETLTRTLKLLDEKKVQINRFRADAASYQKEIIEMMDDRGIEFFIRASNHDFLWENIRDVHYWKPIRYGTDEIEIAEFSFIPFVKNKANLGTHFAKHADKYREYRIVVTRRPHSKGTWNNSSQDRNVYRCLITNNWTMTDEEVLAEYNHRGVIEQGFDILNNDWNWSCMP